MLFVESDPAHFYSCGLFHSDIRTPSGLYELSEEQIIQSVLSRFNRGLEDLRNGAQSGPYSAFISVHVLLPANESFWPGPIDVCRLQS